MQTYGTFGKFIKRNEKTGVSVFSLINDDKTVLVSGIVQGYAKYTPLSVEGTESFEDGKEILRAEDVRACGYRKDVSIRFLSENDAVSTGTVMAERICDTTGADIFSYVRQHHGNPDGIRAVSGVSEESIRKLFDYLYDIVTFETLLKDVQSSGGSYYNAWKLFAVYRSSAGDVYKANPYTLLYAGADLSLCEQLAGKAGMKGYDRKRTKAVVAAAVDLNAKSGNTRIEFGRLCSMIHRMEEKAGGYFRTRDVFIAEEILSDRYMLEHKGSNIFVYRKDDAEAEERISGNIARLMQSASAYDKSYDTADVEKQCGIRYSDDQVNAFHMLDRSGIFILTGGPGTGKTTALNGILTAYRQMYPNKQIRLCAPTGCAARRMESCTGEKAETIHRLLGIRPYENIAAVPSEKMDADLVIVDEASMIDTMIMARLLCGIKNGAEVIFVGDEDQLPSVGEGNVFGDMIKSGIIPVYRLRSNFRQGNRSLIIENSRKVIRGDKSLVQGKSFRIARFEDENSMIGEAERIASSCCERKVPFKLYTSSRQKKFHSGTICMNRDLHDMLFPDTSPETSVTYGPYTFTAGDSILFTRNNYDADGGGYYNGQEGIVKDIQRHGSTVTMSVESDGHRIQLSGKNLEDIELAYAITAHKSQGGECGNAVILIPKEPKALLKKQILYVEITRARKNVIILSEGDALDEAVSYKGNIRRETGLCEKLSAQQLS